MDKIIRTERGWGAHYICAGRCTFRRNTLLEYKNKKIIVSTVGCFRPSHDSEIETIGFNRYYETMVFEAQFENPYWEANISKQLYFDLNCTLDKCEHETDLEANDMHETIVSYFIKELKNNGL